MNLVEFTTHGQPVFVNVAHVVTVRPLLNTDGAAVPGKTSVALSSGNPLEIDGDPRELAARLGTIFHS